MPTSPPPNILMIVTDQERFDIVGRNGSEICRTPALDTLADEGVRFNHAFVPIGLCSPSRASLLTGLYPHAHGIFNNTHDVDAITKELDPALPTFPQSLVEAEYRLGYVGKWHVGQRNLPGDHGFHDVYSKVYDVAQAESDRPLDNPISVEYPGGTMNVAGVDPRPIDETDTHVDADRAIQLLDEYAKRPGPFLLRVDFEGPHHPYMPPEPYASMYDPATIPPWPNFAQSNSAKPAAEKRLLHQRGVAGMTWTDWQPIVAHYFGFMTFIDSEIGRILAALTRLGLADNTVVIHTTDHGDMTGSHGGQFNKGPVMYDELYRVPLIIRDPRSSVAGETCSALVSTLDLMPTIIELADLEPPNQIHGRSLLPLLADPHTPDPTRDAVYAEYHGEEWGLYSQRFVRTHDMKYVYSPHGTDELYDLRTDPYELTNMISATDVHPQLPYLQGRLIEWMSRTEDPLARWASRAMPPTET